MSAIVAVKTNENRSCKEQGMSMMAALRSYPADDVRVLEQERLFLGCHAQWITPESVGEWLPYYDEHMKLAITADAMIDNRDELFDKLGIPHEERKTMPDSLLILRSYDKWQERCPQYLIGDYAFVIYDERRNRLYAARDFSGYRTLYYYADAHHIACSTTIQPLLQLPGVSDAVNEHWLAQYLAIPGNNEAVDMELTVYKQIQQLPPAHYLCYENGRTTVSRYHTFEMKDTLRFKTDEQYVEAFEQVFNEAIASRMRTRQHIGSHLSGGLDSGSVSAFAAQQLQQNNQKLHTFSYVPDDRFTGWSPYGRVANERPYIEATVRHSGNMIAHFVDGSGVDPLDEIDDWLGIMEMPYKFYGTTVWIKKIYALAHHHQIGILLNGGRGNLTVSWGPALHYYAQILRRLRWVKLNKELLQYCKNIGRSSRRQLLPIVSRLAFPAVGRRFISDADYRFPVYINSTLAEQTGVFETLREHGIEAHRSFKLDNAFTARRRHFQEVYPWNATGTCATKMSLRYPLWKRDPTNDLRVINFCLSVPSNQFVQNGVDRALIRRATERVLPNKVRLNQSNKGIQGVDCVHRLTPSWPQFIAELRAICQDSAMQHLIDVNVLQPIIDRFAAGPNDEWSLDNDYTIAMRCLIIYRFLLKIKAA